MAKIPMGNFGNMVAAPAPRANIPAGAYSSGEGLQRLGDAMMRTAGSVLAASQQEQESLQQVKLAGELQDRQMQYESVLSDIGRRTDAGELDRKAIQEAFKSATSLLPQPSLDGLPPSTVERARQGLAMIDHKAQMRLDVLMADGMKTEARFSVDRLLDGADKQMADPNASPEKVMAFMDTPGFRSAAKLAFGDAAESRIQEGKDKAWFTAGKNRLIAAGNDIEALRGFIVELDDDQGRFANRLDGDKKNALKVAAQSLLEQVMRRDQHEADKRVADAGKAIQEYREQIMTTTKARPDDYLGWAERVRGTSAEAEFRELQTIEREVQKVIALPPEQQDKFLGDARAAQRIHGAGEKQIKMLNALEDAVGRNRKLMSEEPLRYLTERTGRSYQPLTPALLQQGGDAVIQELRGRLSDLHGLRKTTGGRTDLNLFSKDETDQIGNVLADSPPAAQGMMLGLLRTGINDPSAYADTVRRLAKDDSVLAFAGVAHARGLRNTAGMAVSDLLLEGRAVLRDGSFKMPSEKSGDTSMQRTFNDTLGNAIEPGASARNDAFQAAKAIYAKIAKDAGLNDGVLNADLFGKAVQLATGGVIDHAGYKTIPPYGMPADVFNDKAIAAKQRAATAHGYPADSFAGLQLRPIAPNRYEVLNGQRRQTSKDGTTIFLTIE